MGKKLFDYVIGNPPYNEDFDNSGDNGNFAKPVYNLFMDAAYKVSDRVELIHPARFLFNAGSTPKKWNQKILNDPHFKVLKYEDNAARMFPNTDIKGGIAITLHDKQKDFGAIKIFPKYTELNGVLKKVALSSSKKSLMDIIYIQNRFNLEALYEDHPECKSSIGSNGKDSRFEKNIFLKIPLFSKEYLEESIKTIGIYKGKRQWRYLPSKYVDKNHENLAFYKVVLPVANGRGELGEVFSTPIVEKPFEAYTRSFIGIGAFEKEEEANAALKYIKTKFARTMLSFLKATQMNNKDVWACVPLQDFTKTSDIDWSKSVHEIDLQLYKKYGLTDDEINFIETHVKEMA